MPNKKYNEFSAGTYDISKIFLQADATTGELEKINLPATSRVTILQFIISTFGDTTGNISILRNTSGGTISGLTRSAQGEWSFNISGISSGSLFQPVTTICPIDNLAGTITYFYSSSGTTSFKTCSPASVSPDDIFLSSNVTMIFITSIG